MDRSGLAGMVLRVVMFDHGDDWTQRQQRNHAGAKIRPTHRHIPSEEHGYRLRMGLPMRLRLSETSTRRWSEVWSFSLLRLRKMGIDEEKQRHARAFLRWENEPNVHKLAEHDPEMREPPRAWMGRVWRARHLCVPALERIIRVFLGGHGS